jgi:hypothetical protein
MQINTRNGGLRYGRTWLNCRGTPTGRVEHVREGERLPRAPRGFSWRQIEEG